MADLIEIKSLGIQIILTQTASDKASMEELIRQAYQLLLGRSPEPDDLIAWAEQVEATGDPGCVLAGIAASDEYKFKPKAALQSPFWNYNSCLDLIEIIRRHAKHDLQASPHHQTNFLGVRVDPQFCPLVAGLEGTIEPIPVPANWHADIAEWGAALRAVDLAKGKFTIVELGCGWGCWLNNTGVAARNVGLDVALIGVEGDPGHVQFAIDSTAANEFMPAQVTVHSGIAAATKGTALFPRQQRAGADYGNQPVFGATSEQRSEALRSGSHDVLDMLPLVHITEHHARIDLLHVDIQGGEADFIAGSINVMKEKVAYLLVGTHSRQIEGKIFDTMLAAGWILEIERPAILSLSGGDPAVIVDGVQGWLNPSLRAV